MLPYWPGAPHIRIFCECVGKAAPQLCRPEFGCPQSPLIAKCAMSGAPGPSGRTTRDYQHHQTGEDNGDAHLKSLIIHHEVIAPVTNGKLDFGPWQQIFYAEFDGQRDKRVLIKVMGE